LLARRLELNLLMREALRVLWSAGAFALSGCNGDSPPPDASASPAVRAGAVNAERLANATREGDQWFTNGRDASGSYFSPLADINRQTIASLGFAWSYPLGTNRGLEATPIVVDGVMYAVGNWGRLYSLDAATGRERWTYDPQSDGQWGRYACCDAVNRG